MEPMTKPIVTPESYKDIMTGLFCIPFSDYKHPTKYASLSNDIKIMRSCVMLAIKQDDQDLKKLGMEWLFEARKILRTWN